jgi:hypothetical protein
MMGFGRMGVRLKRHGKLNIALAVLVALFLAVVTLVLFTLVYSSGRRTVDLSRYVSCSFTGLNGRGTVTMSLDERALDDILTDGEKNAVLIRRIQALVSEFTLEASRDSGLSNGEILDITVVYDEDRAEKLKCRFKNATFKVQVEGLEDGNALDVFDNVEVVVAGVSPNAYASVVNKWQDENLKSIAFSLDKSVNISLGDVLTVTCVPDDESLAQLGINIISRTRQFKVDTLDSYVQSVDGLDIGALQTISDACAVCIRQETEDMTFRMLYKASRDSSYLFQYNNEWVNSVELMGVKLLVRNNAQAEGTFNYVEMLYKANIENASGAVDVYFAFEFPSAIRSADGTFQLNSSDLAGKYSCGMDYNELYGQVVLSKENSYDIFDIDQVK